MKAGSSAIPDKPARGQKPPLEMALQMYRLRILQGKKQKDIAEEMSKRLGRRFTQGAVSRYIKQVEKWISDGNILPELPRLTKKPDTMDPAELEKGRRLDGRVSRQRPRRDD